MLFLSFPAWGNSCLDLFPARPTEATPVAIIKVDGQNAKTQSYVEDIVLNPFLTQRFFSTLFTSTKISESLTASRIEERFIVKAESLGDIRKNSLEWAIRDPKPEGAEFTTITAYAGKIILPLESGENANVKIRLRKYFRHKDSETATPENTQEIFRGFTVLELKMSGVGRGENEVMVSQADNVYKIRAFVHDTLLERIINFKAGDFRDAQKMRSLIEEVTNTPYSHQTFNAREEVTQLFESLFYLGNINENIFRIQTVISYNRDSYSATAADGNSYQLTSDRNIRIFPAKDIRISRMVDYLLEKPTHIVEQDKAFVELKSPISAVAESVFSYKQLFTSLMAFHIQGVDRSGGKFSLSQKTSEFRLEKAFELYQQNTLSAQMSSEGTLYFLIKGTANLPTPPNRKKIVELGEIAIALPIDVNGQIYRAVVEYKPYILSGERYGIVDKFFIVDQTGKKIEMETKPVFEIPSDIKTDPAPAQILVNNERLIFPSVLSPALVNQYKDFFSHFYTNYSKREGNPREIENLATINNKGQLATYTWQMKLGNTMSYLWSRLHRVATQAIIIAGVSASVTYFTLKYQESQTPPTSFPGIINPAGTGIEIQSANGNGRFLVVKGPEGEWLAIPIESVPSTTPPPQ